VLKQSRSIKDDTWVIGFGFEPFDLSDEPVACAAEADVAPPSRRFSGSFGLIKISIDPGSSTGASTRAEAHTDETVDVDQCVGRVAVR